MAQSCSPLFMKHHKLNQKSWKFVSALQFTNIALQNTDCPKFMTNFNSFVDPFLSLNLKFLPSVGNVSQQIFFPVHRAKLCKSRP